MAFLGTFDTKPKTLGGELSKGLGTGIAGALDRFAQSKLSEIERQRTTMGLMKTGIPKEQAEGLSMLPPDLQKSFLAAQAKQTTATAKEQQAINKESGKFVSDLSASYKGVENADQRLNRFKTLIQKGSLPYASTYKLWKNLAETGLGTGPDALATAGVGAYLGGPPGAVAGLLINPILRTVGGIGQAVQKNITARDTEEYQKLTLSFLNDMKGIFGGRIPIQEMERFLESLPSLDHTDAGKEQIINNMQLMNEGIRTRYKAMKEIIAANGGRRPANLELLVEEYAAPVLDQLARQFVGSTTNSILGTSAPTV